MAAFPSIQATGRAYEVPGHAYGETAQANGTVQYKQGGIIANRPLRIEFNPVKLAVAEQITDHYVGQRQHDPFSIPATIWQSHPDLYDLTPANHQYRYLSPPQRAPVGNGFFSVTIELESFTTGA